MARLTSLFCGEKMVNVWRSGTVRPDGAWCAFVIVDTENATVGRRAAASQARRTRRIVGRGRMLLGTVSRGVARSKYVGWTDMASAEREPITGNTV